VSLDSSTGLTHDSPPPEAEPSEVCPQGPPRFQADGERETGRKEERETGRGREGERERD